MFCRKRECFKTVVRRLSLRPLHLTFTPCMSIGFSVNTADELSLSETAERRISPAAATSSSSTLSLSKRTGPNVNGRGTVVFSSLRNCTLSCRLAGPSSCSDFVSTWSETWTSSSGSSFYFLPFFWFFFLACCARAARRRSSAAFAMCFLAFSNSLSRLTTSYREFFAISARSATKLGSLSVVVTTL